MHTHGNLVKEVEEKLVEVQKALGACETEKSLLNKNLTSVKQVVEDSFKRHIGTLQCRAKWLMCHADSIFHLKEGSLDQQVAELELISNELKSCLEASECNLNGREDIKMMARNVLQNASKVSIQPCESGSMSFVAHDEKMEESIVSFGDIDVNSGLDHSPDFDLISDEGIVVVENPPKPQNSFEMEVKSIEMHHLTAQSANSEKEDFERIEMEMQPVNTEAPVALSQLSQVDSAFEEDTNSSRSVEWLHPSSAKKNVDEKPAADSSKMADDDDDEFKNVSESTDKVPLWLKNCEDANPWIRDSRSNSMEALNSAKIEVDDDEKSLKSHKRSSSQARLSFNGNEDSANLRHMHGIASSSNSKFLRIDVENTGKSTYSLDHDLGSLVLLEHNTKESNVTAERLRTSSADRPRSSTSSNLEHFIGIFESPNSSFLRGAEVAVDSRSFYGEDSNSSHMILVDKGPEAASDCESEWTLDSFSTFPSNLNHVDRILGTPHSEFLVSRGMSDDCRVLTETFIKPTTAVNHMRKLEMQPDHKFLRCKTKTKTTVDPGLCEWLRGTTANKCVQCLDVNDCSFNDKFDGNWIKTANDW